MSDVPHRSEAIELMERLHDVGGRRTPARQWVLEVLAASADHLAAAEIHRRLAERHTNVDPSTVHRTLRTLTAHGLIHVLSTPGEARYGMAHTPHHHVACSVCGAVAELPLQALPNLVTTAAGATGYHIDAPLTLFGHCPACNSRSLAPT
jgi:Fe2+ or Zn2+ uptake regulation protein